MVSELEDRVIEAVLYSSDWIFFFNEQNHRNMWDNIKSTNICVMGLRQDEENDNGAEKKSRRNNGQIGLNTLIYRFTKPGEPQIR